MRSLFFCIDGHTAGNPVRLVVGGAPFLRGATMSAMRQDFIARFDWIRSGLMFEPRGHDIMSGGFIYPPLREDCDASILFIETSGVLPMCGHGSIGMITFGLEHGLLQPREPGALRIEVPAGVLDVSYTMRDERVETVRLVNVPSFLLASDVAVEDEELGALKIDVAYGGNFYAIVEPQGFYQGVDGLGAGAILRISPRLRRAVNEAIRAVHPADPTIQGVSHVLWADPFDTENGRGRSAVFYGEKAIDRSPCGTGTSARLAQLAARGRLSAGAVLRHESYIRSAFVARVEQETQIAGVPAIIPSIEGSAYVTGYNQIWIDKNAPYPGGFSLV